MSRYKKIRKKPDSLAIQMGRVLEKLVDSRQNDPEVLELVPRPDFLLDYVFLILKYREDQLKPEGERDNKLEKEISEYEKLGRELSFPPERLIATARAIAERTPTREDIAIWKEMVLQARKKLAKAG